METVLDHGSVWLPVKLLLFIYYVSANINRRMIFEEYRAIQSVQIQPDGVELITDYFTVQVDNDPE